LTLLTLTIASTALANGASKLPKAPERSPQEKAVLSYNEGIGNREKAAKLEAELAGTTDSKKQESLRTKIDKKYESIVKQQLNAVKLDPNLYQAYGELGYAYRKLGNYTDALTAYDKALAMQPGYADAIEYRGEAYLGLNRIDDAKTAYLTLFQGGDQKGAAKLGVAMTRWVNQHKQQPGDVPVEDVARLSAWLSQRSEIATQMGASASGAAW
jgi:tetratricopeptide (TPR) repeat protein